MTTATLSLDFYQGIVSGAAQGGLNIDTSPLDNFVLDFESELNSYGLGSLVSVASTQLVWSEFGYTSTLSGSGINPVGSLAELETAINNGVVTGALNLFTVSLFGTTIGDLTFGPVASDPNRMLTLVTGNQELHFYGDIPATFEGYIDFLDLAVQLGSFSTMSASEQNQLISDLAAYDLNGFAVIDDGETLFSFNATGTMASLSVLGFELTITGTFPDNLGVFLEMYNAVEQATGPISSLTFFDGIGNGLAIDTLTFTDPDSEVLFSAIGPFVDETSFDEVDLTINGGAQADDISLFDLVGNTSNINLVSSGNGGDDTLTGEAGNDTLVGGQGNDLLTGLAGDDSLRGGSGNDLLLGGTQRDYLSGGNNADRLRGGLGRDTLEGGNGDDRLEGGKGRDRLEGGDGEDRLIGGNNNDNLFGQAGNDRLEGGTGNDRLTGGKNADTFVFEDGFGDDTITDFAATNNSEDIDLSAVTAITDYADLLANHIDDSSGTVIIDDGAGNTITLTGITSIGQLDAGDFLF